MLKNKSIGYECYYESYLITPTELVGNACDACVINCSYVFIAFSLLQLLYDELNAQVALRYDS